MEKIFVKTVVHGHLVIEIYVCNGIEIDVACTDTSAGLYALQSFHQCNVNVEQRLSQSLVIETKSV